MPPAIRCVTHPHALAGWRCATCERALCPVCTASLSVGQGEVAVCAPCGGPAQPIRVRRAELHPFGLESLGEATRWPFRRDVLLSAFAAGLVVWLVSMAGALAGLFAGGLALASLFHVTVLTARGEDEIRAAGDFRGFFEDVLGPLMRATLAAMWVYMPAVWSLVLRHGARGSLDALQRSPDPLSVALLAAGSFLFPMALLAGALGTPLRHLLNPLVVVGYALRLGKDYVLLSAYALVVSLALALLLAVLTAIDAHVRLPGFLVDAALFVPALMLFRAMGLLVRARGDELGYGGDSAYLVPVLGDTRPALRRTLPAGR